MKPKTCSYKGCNNPSWSGGRCKYHPLKKGKPRLKRSPIKKVSGKQAKKNKAYSVMRKTFMEHHPLCKRCGAPATDLHHVFHRTGKAMLDTSTWMSLCRSCHDWVHTHPKEAISRGYLASPEQRQKYYE